MAIAGAVLASGASARMGAPKALLDFRGQPFVVRILEALVALEVKPSIVVLGPDAVRITPVLAPYDCLVLEHPAVDAGTIGSLRTALAGLGSIRPRGLIAWPVALPHVRIATVERVIETYRRTRPPAVVPTFGGRWGEPVLWDDSLFSELARSAAATRDGPQAVLRAHRRDIATVAVDDPAVLDGIDTPEDYERLIRDVNRDAY